jgi:hypothetical protein
MHTVRDGLDAVRDELTRLDRPVAGLLNPGLDAEAVRKRLGDDVPAELVEWFGWADGVREEPDQLVDEVAFIPGYVLLGLDEALEFKAEVGLEGEENVRWLPLLVSPGADFYAALWTADEAVQAASYVQGADEATVYTSLSLLLRTFTQSFRTGAFDVDDEGFLEMDPELSDRVYEAINGSPTP